jgi:sodium-independent sulfate anion transporter 11
LVRKRLPVLNWLPQYRPSTAAADLVAGITVGLTLIPQSIAYASLAGLHAQVRIRKKSIKPLAYL